MFLSGGWKAFLSLIITNLTANYINYFLLKLQFLLLLSNTTVSTNYFTNKPITGLIVIVVLGILQPP